MANQSMLWRGIDTSAKERKSKEGRQLISQIKDEYTSTDHPEAAHDKLIKQGDEIIGTDHSTAVRNEPEADE
jgi:hypothetical protein